MAKTTGKGKGKTVSKTKAVAGGAGEAGYEEVADLEDASDAELLQLGLRNVECRRLRRYLAAPEQNRPP